MSEARPLPGVLALGDSITNGEGQMVLGVHCRSWAQWLAMALDVPVHNLARDGAVVADVIAEQLPRVRSRYAVAAVYAGVNDVRAVNFDGDAYAVGMARVLARAAAHADRMAVCTIPVDLGRPRAGAAKVAAANVTLRALAADHGAAVVALDDLRGRTLVLPDAVHPTALGQLEIADRAARALGVRPPSAAVHVHRSPRALIRYALLSRLPAAGRDGRRRAVEALVRRVGR